MDNNNEQQPRHRRDDDRGGSGERKIRRDDDGGGYHMKKHRIPKNQEQKKPYINRKFPDRWSKYPPLGVLMPDTRFIAFKTPLANHFFEGKDDIPFMIPDIVKEVEKSGKKLGLVFDLTATTRYYESSEWLKYGVRYEKLFCPGHNIHQQANVVEKFISAVDKYFANHKDENLIIGVHCTHGINRTGFLICRYLMQRKGWDAAKAIGAFEASRGIKIERSEYINALLNHKTSGHKSRRSSHDNSNDSTTWRPSSSSWRTSDSNGNRNNNSSSSWRPRSSNNHYNGSRNYSSSSVTKTYRPPADSWLPDFSVPPPPLPAFFQVQQQQRQQQLDPVEEKKCQEATNKLRGLLNIGGNLSSKK